MAQRDKLRKHGGASSAMNKKVLTKYLNENYNIEILDAPSEITDTGLLAVGKILPKIDNGLPTFVFRWDGKTSSLDVDPQPIRSINSRFLARFRSDNDKKFFGHHPIKRREGRVFDTNIIWEGRVIYEGAIQFNLTFDFEAFANVGCRVTANVKTERGHAK